MDAHRRKSLSITIFDSPPRTQGVKHCFHNALTILARFFQRRGVIVGLLHFLLVHFPLLYRPLLPLSRHYHFFHGKTCAFSIYSLSILIAASPFTKTLRPGGSVMFTSYGDKQYSNWSTIFVFGMLLAR